MTSRLLYGQEFSHSGGQYSSGSRRESQQRYNERYDDATYGRSRARRYHDDKDDVHSHEVIKTDSGQNRRYSKTARLREASDFSPLDYGSRLERMRDRHHGQVTSLYKRDSMHDWRNDSRRDLPAYGRRISVTQSHGKTLRDSRPRFHWALQIRNHLAILRTQAWELRHTASTHIEEQLRQVKQARKSIQAKQEYLKRLLHRYQSLETDQMDDTSRSQLALLHKKMMELNERKQGLVLEEQYLTRTHKLLCDEQQKQQPQQQHQNQQHRHVQHRSSGGRRQVLPGNQQSGRSSWSVTRWRARERSCGR